nr:uncharacterized protein LOC133596092 [Nerophis lumbriciformis]
MKTIYLLRHAKSDWNAPGTSDHDRPLNARGRAAADRIGRFLPQQTVDGAVRAGGWDCPVEISEALYLGSPAAVLETIQQQPESCSSVLLAGHEPGWSGSVARLTGGGNVRMVTAAIARLDVAVERWNTVEPGAGQLTWLVTPKLLARAGFE